MLIENMKSEGHIEELVMHQAMSESERAVPRPFGSMGLKELEEAALDKLREPGKTYFCAGASTRCTPRDNEEALKKYRIQPRVFRDVSEASLRSRVLGSEVQCPIGVAPTGFHFLAHRDAEIASARGCSQEGCLFILSSVSSIPMEEVANGLGSPLWMQVYILKDRSVTLDLVRRAESCGFAAIVVTADSPVSGQWKNDLPDRFVDAIKNRYAHYSVPLHTLQDSSVTFEDLAWLSSETALPVVVKGVLSGEDALHCVECGASAIYVSNHGSRQIQRVLPTIEVLEEVVDAVRGHDADVYFDGGIRSGSDVFVALALGAKAVFVGRPAIWGLALGGGEGVRRVLQLLKDQLLSTMKLAGVKNVKEIQKRMVRKV